MQTTKRMGSTKLSSGGIWGQILSQAARTAELHNSHLLLFGRRDVGKTSIIRSLQSTGFGPQKVPDIEFYQDNDSVSALDFACVNVRNIEDDDNTVDFFTKMGIWILQNSKHQDLLMNQFRPTDMKHAAVMICLDLSQPWTLRDELIMWLDFTANLIPLLSKGLGVDEQEAMKDKVAHYIETYKNSVEKETAEHFAKRHVAGGANITDESISRQLKINLGVPVIVCVCKSDAAASLDTRLTQGHIDVVEAHLRQLCISYGAALIFCSSSPGNSSSKNRELLYKYLMHRVQDFEFSEPASTDQKDAIFYPSGWDTEEEINAFAKTTIAQGFAKPYGTIINRTVAITKPSAAEKENTRLEEMSLFLGHALANNSFLAPSAPPPHLPAWPSGTKESPTPIAKERRSSKSAGQGQVGTSNADGMDTARASARRQPEGGTQRGDPASLRTFFQTLLVKGQKQGGGENGAEGGASPEHDASDPKTSKSKPPTSAGTAKTTARSPKS